MANVSYSLYAIEQYVSIVKEHLRQATEDVNGPLNDDERDVVMRYMHSPEELVSYLRQLGSHWELYLENIDQRSVSSA